MTISLRSQGYKPDHFNFTRDVVDYWSQVGGDPIAMVWKASDGTNPEVCHDLRFSHFSQRARDVAQGLRRIGVQKGDVLLLLSSKTPDWYEILCGAMLAGVVVCPNPSSILPWEIELRAQKAGASVLVGESKQIRGFLSERELQKTETCVRQIIQIGDRTQSANCDPTLTLYQGLLELAEPAEEIHDFKTDPHGVCLMYFTSGTTGQSKIVQHSHLSYLYAHIVTGEHLSNIVPGKMLWSMSEQGRAKAAWALFGAWSQGAALFIDSYSGPFDPERVRDNLSRYPINVFCAAPTVYRQLVTGDSRGLFQDQMPQALERCVSAGEALAPQVIMEWYDLTDGLFIYDGFGQTETSILCGHYKSIPVRPGSLGKALPGIPLHVLNDKRQIAPPFEEGDLAIRVAPEADLSCFLSLFKAYLHESSSGVRPVGHVKSRTQLKDLLRGKGHSQIQDLPYHTFADDYDQYRKGSSAEKAVDYHVQRLQGLSMYADALWPPQKVPGWMKGDAQGWVAPEGWTGERELLDKHQSIGVQGLDCSIRLGRLPQMRSELAIVPATIAKCACVLINLRLTGQEEAIFTGVDSGRSWPSGSNNCVDDQDGNPFEIDGPTMTFYANRIRVLAGETAREVLTRLQREQAEISAHAHAPLDAIKDKLIATSSTGHADVEMLEDVIHRQTFNWLMQHYSESDADPIRLTDCIARSDIGFMWFPALLPDNVLHLNVTWDDAQLRASEVYEFTAQFMSAVAWLSDPDNMGKPVSECRFNDCEGIQYWGLAKAGRQ
ncbi:hypothetical protein BJX99DRAFT_253435 [Aspergillus californicus]